MNQRGQLDVGFSTMTMLVLVIVLLLIIFGLVPQFITKPLTGFRSSFEFRTKFANCQRTFVPGAVDIDRDGCADYQDFCVDTTATEARHDVETLAKRGNNLCDKDGDNVPDACDDDPTDSYTFCKLDASGKCQINPKFNEKVPTFEHCDRQVTDFITLGQSFFG